jgi:hypothetical protein
MILRRLDAPDKLNDFFRLPIEPLAQADAHALLSDLADHCKLHLSLDAIDCFFQLIGPPVPYFIQLFVAQISLEAGLAGKEITPSDVTAVYQKRLLGPTCHKYFDYYRQRLKRYGTAAERAAIAILREIAGAATGRVSESVLYAMYEKSRRKGATEVEFREIMADLECDWYVTLDTTTNEYCFLLPMMKAWWERYYRRVAPRNNSEKS